jgi:hypothetical protein
MTSAHLSNPPLANHDRKPLGLALFAQVYAASISTLCTTRSATAMTNHGLFSCRQLLARLGGTGPVNHLLGLAPSTKSIDPPLAKTSFQVSHGFFQSWPLTFRLCT